MATKTTSETGNQQTNDKSKPNKEEELFDMGMIDFNQSDYEMKCPSADVQNREKFLGKLYVKY